MARNERGFSLIEVVIATGLTSFVVIAIASAVANAAHASALAKVKGAMRADAINVLADLRASTAYDGAALTRMEGRTATTTIAHAPNDLERIAVRVYVDTTTRPNVLGANGKTNADPIDVAEVTVSEFGETITERETLYNEAPPPGSTVEQ